MKTLLLFSLFLALAQAGPFGVSMDTLEEIKEWALMRNCWGEENNDYYEEKVESASKECHLMEPRYTENDLTGADGVPEGAVDLVDDPEEKKALVIQIFDPFLGLIPYSLVNIMFLET